MRIPYTSSDASNIYYKMPTEYMPDSISQNFK